MQSNLALWILIVIAIVNGFNIVVNRVMNSKLGLHVGALRSSYWNHLVGAIFLLPFLFLSDQSLMHLTRLEEVPWQFYLGGAVGAVFVGLMNYVVPRLGVLKSMMILLSSQMVSGVFFDLYLHKISSIPMAFAGIALIILGTWVGNAKKLQIFKKRTMK